ncbi:MAG TPA: HEAT repeat domain-containing protein [Gemmataceae bacterium]|nr:HEAT repeat domain-containing protein [Gemmataceae bacterium]
MRQPPHPRPFPHGFRAAAPLGLGLLFLALALGPARAATAQALPPFTADPLAQLEKTLKKESGLSRELELYKDKAAEGRKRVENYEKVLKAEIDALNGLGVLAAAMKLTDWRDVSDAALRSGDLSIALLEADDRVEEHLARRFNAIAIKGLQDRDPYRRWATANLIGETAKALRGIKAKKNIARSTMARLDEELVQRVLRDDDLRVRQAAAAAIGQLDGRLSDPKDEKVRKPAALVYALPTFQKSLTDSSQPAEVRRAVAEAMGSLLQIALQGIKDADVTTAQSARDNLVQLSPVFIATLGPGKDPKAPGGFAATGILDANAGVRLASVETLTAAAAGLVELIFNPITEREMSTTLPPGRIMTKTTRGQIGAVMKAFDDIAPSLARLLENEPNLGVRLAALRTAETLGEARSKLSAYDRSLKKVNKDLEGRREGPPRPAEEEEVLAVLAEEAPPETGDGIAQTLEKLRRPLIDRLLTDPSPKARLAAAEALEAMGREAAPAAWQLARAAALDPDRFVRWVAARTLGKLAVREGEKGKADLVPQRVIEAAVVPALARLLADEDLDLRIAAAKALELYGPRAADAVPMLAWSVNAGDPDIRMAAIQALTGIGVAAAPRGLTAMTQALRHPDPRVRREAAQALAHFGGYARWLRDRQKARRNDDEKRIEDAALARIGQAAPTALDALARTLNDSDPQVRQAASDGLLDFTAAFPELKGKGR